MQNMKERIDAVVKMGSVEAALESGELHALQSLATVEALVLGLLLQGVRKYVGIFGHGSTSLGDVLCSYQQAKLLKVFNVRHEVEASHIAATLRWQYRERVAVFTSIGPGALQALAGSLLPLSNQLGIYYLLGDETSEDEGYNMQQIPRREQSLFLKLFSVMGASYALHTPRALPTALKRGLYTTGNPQGEQPFYLLLPMNVQPQMLENFNLRLLSFLAPVPAARCRIDPALCEQALTWLRSGKKLAVKLGRGALGVEQALLQEFLQLSGAVLIHGPSAGGILPASHPRNLGVAGSKGSICGNYAMEHCQTLLVIGARAVCQWDCSGTGWLQVERILHINTSTEDAGHYNRSLALVGDANTLLRQLVEGLRQQPLVADPLWLSECLQQRQIWEDYLAGKLRQPLFFDSKWQRPLLSQMAAIDTCLKFCRQHQLVSYFDAGDVQATGFQLTRDEKPGQTFTDTGSSFMGFAVSALVASGLAEQPSYGVAFSGDGSFFMNPQVLIDAVAHQARGMIVLFDNRRMSAISSLQHTQFGRDFATDDLVEVDYVALAQAVRGVRGFFGGYAVDQLNDALAAAAAYEGLSLVHVPVYYGNNKESEIGAFGRWNVGNWCAEVQHLRNTLALA